MSARDRREASRTGKATVIPHLSCLEFPDLNCLNRVYKEGEEGGPPYARQREEDVREKNESKAFSEVRSASKRQLASWK